MTPSKNTPNGKTHYVGDNCPEEHGKQKYNKLEAIRSKPEANWIADRIRTEYDKHAKTGLDWALIAAIHIESELNIRLMKVLGGEDD